MLQTYGRSWWSTLRSSHCSSQPNNQLVTFPPPPEGPEFFFLAHFTREPGTPPHWHFCNSNTALTSPHVHFHESGWVSHGMMQCHVTGLGYVTAVLRGWETEYWRLDRQVDSGEVLQLLLILVSVMSTVVVHTLHICSKPWVEFSIRCRHVILRLSYPLMPHSVAGN